MAANIYGNKLRELMDSPGSFTGTPDYQFARDQGLQATSRQMAGQRGSGNALAALTKYGAGLASQNYNTYADRLGRMSGQEQQYDLGQTANANTATANANALTLGQGQLALGQGRLGLDRDLGMGGLDVQRGRLGLDAGLGFGQLDNQRRGQDQQFGLGMYRAGNDFTLGQGQNQNTADRNWWDYSLGSQAQGTNRYQAETNRGDSLSQDWQRRQQWGNRDPWSRF